MTTRILLAIAILASVAACKIGGGETVDRVAASCSPVENACAAHSDCCSYACEFGSCARNPVPGGACRTSDDCDWTMTCIEGACTPGATCRNDADVCTYVNDCCSGNCAGGTCAPNHAPTASLGADRTVPWYTSVALAATVADADGDQPLVYGWTLVSGPSLAGWTSASPSPSVFLDVPGVYVFRLVVTDGPPTQRNRLTSTPDEVAITAANQPPVVSAGEDATLSRSSSLVLQGAVSDPNLAAAPVTCAWRQTPPGGAETTVATFSPCPAAPQHTFASPQSGPEGAWTFTLVASDGVNEASDARTVTVVNDAPVANAGPDRAGNLGPGETVGAAVSATATATDVNQDADFTWTWTFDQVAPGSALTTSDLSGAGAATVSFAPDARGAYVLRVRVCDPSVACDEDTVTVDVDRHVKDLGHSVADAEWAAGQIFAVGADDAGAGKLWIYAGEALQRSIALPSVPTQVGVDRTGKLVVVGDTVSVRWIDLNLATPVVETLSTGAPYAIGDVAVADTRYALLLPATGTPYLQILDVSAKAVDATLRQGRYAAALKKDASTDGRVFVVDASGDLTEYAVQNPGTLSLARFKDRPAPACTGRLWATENGNHLVDACAGVYTTALLEQITTALPGETTLRHAHAASTSGTPVTLDASGATLRRWDASFASPQDEAIPVWGQSGTPWPTSGRFAFTSADGTTRWVIVEANGRTGLVTFP